MAVDNTIADKQAGVTFSCYLQIPQGAAFELKFEQGQYNFYLNAIVVAQIQQAQKTGCSLYIPPRLLVTLWYYSFFNNPENLSNKSQNSYIVLIINIFRLLLSKPLSKKTNLQSGFTFNCYYQELQIAASVCDKSDILLQSTVFLSGDIFYKIRRDFLQDPNCLIIVSAHYWLTEQLLSYLRKKLNLLAWELASFAPTSFVADKLYQAKAGILLSIFAWFVATIVFAIIRYVIANKLQRFTSIDSKYVNWIAWGITCLIPSVILSSAMNVLFFVLLSVFVPLLVKWVLRFILPRIGKFTMRWLLFA
ncbi:hypothetical protein I8751_02000 [Nostocaceae cyanobacterium CENA357]|uniref:Uncharacterized protein n=1 Tax=Atlanticothrix silvestris CENA357 TaxID=1725252 RepID=A0A8J7H7T4_9CYAN|nr:hypothetical protein [Atlanticothrix silvestris]MBH8551173.1 hypothetical protein [Atlanticothrix silvestris CENA357]